MRFSFSELSGATGACAVTTVRSSSPRPSTPLDLRINPLWPPPMAKNGIARHSSGRPSAPNDEMVLEAAINGRADAPVTYNLADFAGAAERFRISVLRPAELLKKVRLRP